MLVTFALEMEAINSSTTSAHIKRLLDTWERFGILAHPPRGDTSVFHRLKGLTPSTRKYWMSAWERVVKNNGNAYRSDPIDGNAHDWEKIDTPDALADCQHRFEVGILEETRAIILGIPDGESRLCGPVEGVRLWDIDVSDKFQHALTLSKKPIGIGEATDKIWEERFQRLAACSQNVVIVDQHAARSNNVNGIFRLLRFLDRDSRKCRATLYSSPGVAGDVPQAIEGNIRRVAARLAGNGIESLTVRLFDETDFRVYAHDRHIRFDNNVIKIGRGARVFEYADVREATDVDLVTLEPGTIDQKERDLDYLATIVHEFRIEL